MASWPRSWHRRLHVQHAATLAAVALGSAVLVGAPLYVMAAALLEHGLDDRLEGIAELAAVGLTGTNGVASAVDALLANVREEADLDAICVLDRGGGIVRFSAVERAACALDRDELNAAEALGGTDSGHTEVRRASDGTPYLFAFAPLASHAAGGNVVAVRASAPYLERLDALRNLFAAAGIAGVLLVGLLGAWSAKRLVRPVERLVTATGRLGEGGIPEPLEPAGTLELQRLQDAFTAMAVLVRARETALRALAGAVAHEVRNPAHALRLHLGLLKRELGAASPAGVALRLETLQGLLDELDATVQAFLSFARDRAPRRQCVNLRALLLSAAPDATVEAADVDVSVDPVLIGRAVANLVRNALQVGSDRVVVRGACAEQLTIEVEDRGPGFSEALLAAAFEPFVAGRHDGTGLGLAIVNSIARAHGGAARISESGPGRTIVELRLPLR
jgi:signal transduction histidine kinase